jgi:hypothetical protein
MVVAMTRPVLPTVNPIQTGVNGNSSLYVFKLSADGSTLNYATYLGGRNYEVPVSLAVDSLGAAYILDTTNSSDFPATPQAVNSKEYGRSVVVKLTPDGALEYSASFPWVFTQQPIAVDSLGAVTLVGASTNVIFQLSADASRLASSPIPSWNTGSYYYAFVSTTSDGGLWVTGSVENGHVPVPSSGFEPIAGPTPYLRIEDGVVSMPSRIPAHVLQGFAVDVSDRTRIYAATDAGLFASSDNGMTWTVLFPVSSTAIAIDPFDSATLYLGVAINKGGAPGFYRSTDRGQSWTASDSPLLSNYAITSISADPNVPGLVYALGSGFYRSYDSGQTWTAAALPPSTPNDSPSATDYFEPHIVAADPAHPNQVFIAGVTRCLGFCPVVPGVIRSSDAGATVSYLTSAPANTGVLNMYIDPATGDVYFLTGGQLIALRPSNSFSPEPLNSNVAAIAFDPASPGLVYEALLDGSIAQSTDAGVTLIPVAQLTFSASQLAVSEGGVLNASQPGSTTDAYAIRYDASGAITYGTFLSGGSTTEKTSVVTAFNHLLIAGVTGANLPLLNPIQPSIGGDTDGFLAEFDTDGTLLSSTYLGGTGKDEVDNLVPLPDGSVIAIGTTASSDFAANLPPSAIGAGNTFIIHLRQ